VSLKGTWKDVSVVDVIQLIYIGGRTGTLAIQGPASAARFGFQRGRMTNAWRTGAVKLGELLISVRTDLQGGAGQRADPRRNRRCPAGRWGRS
jgi:hypothetical protein